MPMRVRQYRSLALEYLGYAVGLLVLGWLMLEILHYAPQQGGHAYALASFLTGLFCGGYSWRMYRSYRVAAERAAARKQLERPRHWSDRIAAAEAIRARDALRAKLGMDSADNASPSLQAIRLRIAERMAREDREREERERAEREEIDRARIERARTERLRAKMIREGR